MTKNRIPEILIEILHSYKRPYGISHEGEEYSMLIPCAGKEIKLLSVRQLLIIQDDETDSVIKFESIHSIGELSTVDSTVLQITIYSALVDILLEIPLDTGEQK